MTTRAWVWLAAAWFVAACERRLPTPLCRLNSECTEPELCLVGQCRRPCVEDRDCTGAYVCAANGCVPPEDRCSAVDPCENPALACAGAVCVPRCTDGSCPQGFACTVGASPSDRVCTPLVESDAGIDGGLDVTLPDAAGMDVSSLPDAARDASLDAAPDAVHADGGRDVGADAGPPSRYTDVCVGDFFACAVEDGRVRCWGSNDGGRLGDGLSTSEARTHTACGGGDCSIVAAGPVRRADAGELADLTGVVDVACGEANACAVTDDRLVWCWGAATPVLGRRASTGYVAQRVARPLGAPLEADHVTVGRKHACAWSRTNAWCWGENQVSEWPVDGRLGQGSEGTTDVPVAATGFASADELVASGLFTCERRGMRIRCVGFNEAEVTRSGMYGADPIGNALSLASAPNDVTAGTTHACAVQSGGVVCWGGNGNLALGRDRAPVPRCFPMSPAWECDPNPAAVVDDFARAPTWIGLSEGESDTTCAISDAGEVGCWGESSYGAAGVASVGFEQAPRIGALVQRAAGGALSGVRQVVCGEHTCCARLADSIHCWGQNSHGELGNGTRDAVDLVANPRATPVMFP